MKPGICAILAVMLPAIVHAQVLNGDQRLAPLNQIRWEMSKATIFRLCSAIKSNTVENDSAISFDADFFGAPARAAVRFKNSIERPRQIEVKFKKHPAGLPDTLINHFTRTLGKNPARVEKEKSALLFTLRMEIAVWKTTKETVNLIVAKNNQSIFDIYLMISPVIQ